jgi:hypothetical protein
MGVESIALCRIYNRRACLLLRPNPFKADVPVTPIQHGSHVHNINPH